jgi:hypothetical protein
LCIKAYGPCRVTITDPGGEAVWEGDTPSGATSWTTQLIPINQSSWTATFGSWSALLNNVTKLEIRIEHIDNGHPPDEEAGIDNVILSGYSGQADSDSDGITDTCDNCPNTYDPSQLDADVDGLGDVCDNTPGCGGCGQPVCEISCDIDNDGVLNTEDNCHFNCNTQQSDADGDDIGDVCDDTPGCGGCGKPACELEC